MMSGGNENKDWITSS